MVVLQAPKIQFSEKSGASASVSGSLVTFNVNGTTVAQATANASTVLNFSQSETKAGYIKIHATVVELYIDVGDTCGGSVTPALKKEINALAVVKTIFETQKLKKQSAYSIKSRKTFFSKSETVKGDRVRPNL